MHKFLNLFIVLLCFTACSSAYYGAWEKVGYHKRDIMKSRVLKTKKAQEETKEEFSSALEQFNATVSYDGGDLERKYNKLNSIYEDTNDQAKELTGRIDSVEKVSKALFKEWRKELKTYQNQSLKKRSEEQLITTEAKYQSMILAMRRAEDSLDPVLEIFHDNVLFLKHNLNAKAINSLQGEKVNIERKVNALIKEMNIAISEANQFIAQLE